MATIDQVKKHYDKLTAPERFALWTSAGARDDQAERRALLDSAPKVLFEFPHIKGLADGFADLTSYHLIQQLGTAGAFWMLIYLTDGEEYPQRLETIEAEEIPTGETALTLTARRFLEGQEAYKAICAEYGIDPEALENLYNPNPAWTAFTEIIIRRGLEMSETELTDLEATKAAYRTVIETKRAEWSETKAR
jgi:hypothetical protein